MKLFVTVLVEGEYMPKILKKLSDHNFHGSVMPTLSIKKALLNNHNEPVPMFGGISKVIEYDHSPRPMVFVVVKEDEEVKTLARLINEATGGIQDKGFMYALPIDFLEGIE
ncbi:MAG: hypothetical protein NC090_02770 [Anaeroplasma bactoclasticum]|nr:hypothetical protein [Anaeroplasma bactoclasticum]